MHNEVTVIDNGQQGCWKRTSSMDPIRISLQTPVKRNAIMQNNLTSK